MIWEAYNSISKDDFPIDIAAIEHSLTWVKAEFLGDEQQFDALWIQVTSIPQPNWLSNVQTSSSRKYLEEIDGVTKTILEAIAAFVNTSDWDSTQHVLEEYQNMLFQDETETVFEQEIERFKNDDRIVRLLKMHLKVLRACKASGIEKTFEHIKAIQANENDG